MLCEQKGFLLLFDNNTLDPDGWLVVGHIFNCTKTIEKQDAERKNAQSKDNSRDYPTKKILFFCNGEVFFLDWGLLMGGITICFE